MTDDYLRSPAGLVSLRTLVGRDLKPGESVQVIIGRMQDGRMYVFTPPLVTGDPNMTVTITATDMTKEADDPCRNDD